METEELKITNPSENSDKPERKKYSPLPDDAPRNKINRKARPKILTKAVLIYMTPKDQYNLRRNAEKAGFPSYSSYMRFLTGLIVTEDSLIVNLSKRTRGNLQDQAKKLGKSVDDYVRYLANLTIG